MDKETALKILRELHDKALFSERTALETFIPELKESEDEKIRKAILAFVRQSSEVLDKQNQNNMIAWLEKQGDTSEIVNKKKIASDILRGAAINLITWIDYNAAEGNMCLSNMECKDIEDALVSGDWDKIYAYIKKKLEKQGEQKVTWSEEDEKILEDIRFNFVYNKEKMTDSLIIQYNRFFDKIKSLKPQPKQEWSEEDEKRFKSCLNILQAKGIMEATETINTKWLRSLKERIK